MSNLRTPQHQSNTQKPTAPQVWTEIIDVTPEIAKEWLSKRDKVQRPISQSHVSKLASQMTQGKWIFNGEAIKFSPYGSLLDGQHRLSAILESGKAIRCLVIHNISEASYHVMDQGKRRSAADVLAARGHKEYIKKAAIARFVLLFRLGKYKGNVANGRVNADNTDVISFVENLPYTNEMVSHAMSFFRQFPITPASLMGGMHFLLTDIDKHAGEEFMAKFATGVGLVRDCPIYQLRKRIEKDSAAKTAKMPINVKVGLFCKAWNYWRRGKSVKVLQFDPVKENLLELV